MFLTFFRSIFHFYTPWKDKKNPTGSLEVSIALMLLRSWVWVFFSISSQWLFQTFLFQVYISKFRSTFYSYIKYSIYIHILQWLNLAQLLPKDSNNIWTTWHIPWVLLASALFDLKSANFAISRNTDIDCILIHNF